MNRSKLLPKMPYSKVNPSKSVQFGVVPLTLVSTGLAFIIFPLLALGSYFVKHHQQPIHGSSLLDAVAYSVGPSVGAIAFVTLVGLPMGFYLCTSGTRWSRVLALVVRLPLGVPPLVAGVMLLVAFGPYSWIGHFIHGGATNSGLAIFIAQSFTALPFVVEGARGAFGNLDVEAQVVADSLLMSATRRLVQIYIPLAWSAIRSSIVLGFLRAFGEFGSVLLVAYSPASLPIYTYISFEGTGLASTVAPIVITVAVASAFSAGIANLPWPTKLLGRMYRHRSVKIISNTMTSAAKKTEDIAESTIKIHGKVGRFEMAMDFGVLPGCTVLLGPSGAGKTLTLHSLAHHFTPGLNVTITGELADRCGSAIGYVPQKLGLWPHLNVIDNLQLSAQVSGYFEDLGLILDELGIRFIADRYPETLSGGQYQRASLARAMATNSRVGILDEPFSALDAHLRNGHRRLIRDEIKQVFDYLFVVTHDVDEALFLADYLVIVSNGRVLQFGAARAVLDAPNSLEVARILGIDTQIKMGSGEGVALDVANQLISFVSSDVKVTLENERTLDGFTRLGQFRISAVRKLAWNIELDLENSLARLTTEVIVDYPWVKVGQLVVVHVPTRRCFIFE